MILICDEGVELSVVDRMREEGHDVVYMADVAPGSEDHVVLARAAESNAPLVTSDKDFGELVYRQGLATAGVVLLRLAGLSNEAKANAVAAAVERHAAAIHGSFTVISPGRVRIRRKQQPGDGGD